MKPWKKPQPFGLKPAEQDALLEALHLYECIDASLCSGRHIRRGTLEALAKRSFVAEVSAVAVDGDGWTIQPERYKTAWMLTVHGLDVAKHLRRLRDEAESGGGKEGAR